MENKIGQEAAGTDRRPNPWYRWERFPLLPSWGYRPGNRYNPADWWFNWLFLSIWTGTAFGFCLWVELTDQDFLIQLMPPWLHIRLTLPLFPRWCHQKLWRVQKLIERESQSLAYGKLQKSIVCAPGA